MNSRSSQFGFTLVEMIVSLALFSVVVTISVGALLTLIATNEQLQSERTVMTNLSFALDSMTREIRTGTAYFCESRNNENAGPHKLFDDATDLDDMDSAGFLQADCSDGNSSDFRYHGIAFVESGDSVTGSSGNRILYYFNNDERSGHEDEKGKIYRRVGNDAAQSIVSSGITIEEAEFFVTGSDPLSSGTSEIDQPTVTIYIKARETDSTDDKVYEIQTTVVQRILDV